ncbi:gluconokinase [Williamsia sp. CHRR-6]|uniref:gluconokinase n=1 Tax=Williamsia sp. CHRR-6 TaxID=2835871 RepID=UPI001BDB3872|nr:gluconokinase, GntK/IdnK-type [Williamsia sp. CHRR-6]MBT0568092.1 gluconokinase [Williamsia sp. CHRR-6]
MGVSGCGKSIVAAALAQLCDRPFDDADDLHTAANLASMAAGVPLTDTDRLPWLDAVVARMDARAATVGPCVIACSALRRRYRDRLRQAGSGLVFLHLVLDERTLAERLERRRGHPVGVDLLASQLATLEPLTPDEPGVSIAADGPVDTVVNSAMGALRALR